MHALSTSPNVALGQVQMTVVPFQTIPQFAMLLVRLACHSSFYEEVRHAQT